MHPSVDLSMVIPAYNAAEFLEDRLSVLSDYLSAASGAWGMSSWEIVVVDDGSSDGTARLIESCAVPNVVAVSSPQNEGKFAAIGRGMAKARGRCRIFTDADVPYRCEHIGELAERVLGAGVHVAVGDRTLAQSTYREALTPLRQLATDSFKMLTQRLLGAALGDTQCGLKAFRADVAQALFPLMQERGFAGDVELLTIALDHGLTVDRVPVVLAFHGASTVRPLHDGMRMAAALARIRWRRRSGRYASEALSQIAAQRQ